MNVEKQRELYRSLNKKSTLEDIQKYIGEMNIVREFNDDEVEDRMLLLMEEVGELAKAIRKEKMTMGIDTDKIQNYSSSKEEAADVFYVLISVCDLLNISLIDALLEKEAINITRSWNV